MTFIYIFFDNESGLMGVSFVSKGGCLGEMFGVARIVVRSGERK